MAKVIYKGKADFRVLGGPDLDKAGVEGFTQRTFARGVVVQVDDAVADALVDNEKLYGKFEKQEEADEPKQAATDKSETARLAAKSKDLSKKD